MIDNNYEQEEYEEYSLFDESNSDKDKIASDFFEINKLECDIEMLGFEKYKPIKDSSVYKTRYQDGFYVYYSFLKGTDIPIASFWGKNENKFCFFHVNLSTLIDIYIKYQKSRGFTVPPQREN